MAGVNQPGVGCAVVTRSATEPLAKIHHRQPVLLDDQHLDSWLNGAQSCEELPVLEVSFHPVSTRVGNTRHDDRELIVPVDVEEPAAGQTADLFSGGEIRITGGYKGQSFERVLAQLSLTNV